MVNHFQLIIEKFFIKGNENMENIENFLLPMCFSLIPLSCVCTCSRFLRNAIKTIKSTASPIVKRAPVNNAATGNNPLSSPLSAINKYENQTWT